MTKEAQISNSKWPIERHLSFGFSDYFVIMV